jgi:Na+-driven multidrug efflux pump
LLVHTQVAVLLGTLVMVASSLLLLAGRHQLGRLFSHEMDVIEMTAQAVPPLAVSLIGARVMRVVVTLGFWGVLYVFGSGR